MDAVAINISPPWFTFPPLTRLRGTHRLAFFLALPCTIVTLRAVSADRTVFYPIPAAWADRTRRALLYLTLLTATTRPVAVAFPNNTARPAALTGTLYRRGLEGFSADGVFAGQ